jgi:hypothetical protein
MRTAKILRCNTTYFTSDTIQSFILDFLQFLERKSRLVVHPVDISDSPTK